jgi:hypothetical protein
MGDGKKHRTATKAAQSNRNGEFPQFKSFQALRSLLLSLIRLLISKINLNSPK